jgi:hypothetical protein
LLAGVETIDLDFSSLCNDGDPVPTEIKINVGVLVTFANGCEYTESFADLTVNPRQLGDNDSQTKITLPNP